MTARANTPKSAKQAPASFEEPLSPDANKHPKQAKNGVAAQMAAPQTAKRKA